MLVDINQHAVCPSRLPPDRRHARRPIPPEAAEASALLLIEGPKGWCHGCLDDREARRHDRSENLRRAGTGGREEAAGEEP